MAQQQDQGDAEFRRVAELIEHLKSDDVSQRVEATRCLPTIAATLGDERTRGELLPFLGECTDDEDEVLVVLAEQLGRLVDHVGGAQHLQLLLEPLKALAAADEATVRDATVASMQTVINQMHTADVLAYGVQLVHDLVGSEFFTARVSACGLLPAVYSRLSPGPGDRMDTDDDDESAAKRKELRALLHKLCGDDTPMVKRMAAAGLGALAAVAESPAVLEELLALFDRLNADDQDSVRLQTADNCVALARALPREARVARVIPAVRNTAQDASWRVRWSVASKFHEVGAALSGGEVLAPELCEAFEQLLQDPEAEVRTAAAFGVARVGALMGADGVLQGVLPCLRQLVVDGCEHVRAALASVICELAPLLGQDLTIDHLVPLLLQLLRDSNSDVRLNIISKLHSINEVVGMDHLSQSLLPAVMDLAEDDKWRVRTAIIDHTPLLAQQLGPRFFTDSLAGLCLGWLGDDVHSVRIAAAANLRRLSALFGADWARAHVVPKLAEMHANASYLHRMTALNAVQVLAEDMDPDLLQRDVLPLVLEMAHDPVPNIRFNVSKTLTALAPRLGGGAVENAVRPALSALVDDGDRDVRYFARKAIAALG
eukprot:TRINITY_DN262_c1_g2_i1.p1 TRINITY_DN262_c1_g2~~TRINITY_DN262_c1_g2_i1.p1  ORF type:complete len:602 (-),score=254.94 TRINITY_DN262_c1_g2_i1:918-2723(-)